VVVLQSGCLVVVVGDGMNGAGVSVDCDRWQGVRDIFFIVDGEGRMNEWQWCFGGGDMLGGGQMSWFSRGMGYFFIVDGNVVTE
jgi:hypothetical protein